MVDMFGGLTSIDWGAKFAQGMLWVGIVFVVLLFVGVLWFIIWFTNFRIPVKLYDNINGMPRFLKNAKGKISKNKEGVTVFKIFGIKGSMSPPPDEFFSLTKKGRYVNLIKSSDKWQPFKMQVNPGQNVVHDYDVRFWLSQEVNSLIRKYFEESFMHKFGAYIMFVIGILVLGWMYYVLIKQIGVHVDQELSLANTIAEYTKTKISGP